MKTIRDTNWPLLVYTINRKNANPRLLHIARKVVNTERDNSYLKANNYLTVCGRELRHEHHLWTFPLEGEDKSIFLPCSRCAARECQGEETPNETFIRVHAEYAALWNAYNQKEVAKREERNQQAKLVRDERRTSELELAELLGLPHSETPEGVVVQAHDGRRLRITALDPPLPSA